MTMFLTTLLDHTGNFQTHRGARHLRRSSSLHFATAGRSLFLRHGWRSGRWVSVGAYSATRGGVNQQSSHIFSLAQLCPRVCVSFKFCALLLYRSLAVAQHRVTNIVVQKIETCVCVCVCLAGPTAGRLSLSASA